MQKIDLVITRHRPLVELLRERGIITADTPVLEHASISDVSGKHVIGVLPHHLSSKCASITEVPMALTQADREAMTRGDLSLERTREIAGDPVTYYVSTERTWPCVAVFAAAARHAAPWSTFHVKSIGRGVLELESAESTDWAQVDLYRDRYRTMSMGGAWSAWLDENGEEHRDQGPVRCPTEDPPATDTRALTDDQVEALTTLRATAVRATADLRDGVGSAKRDLAAIVDQLDRMLATR